MRYIGLDLGTKKTGIATSDEAGRFAFPESIVDTKDLIESLRKLKEVFEIKEIVVGKSKKLNLESNPHEKKFNKTIEEVKEKISSNIKYVDERFSTLQSKRQNNADKRSVPSGNHNDSSTAALLLQTYLDTINI